MTVERLIAVTAKTRGFRALMVGGYVRDLCLGRQSEDLDVEVYGATPEQLAEFAANIADDDVSATGRSFGVLKLRVHGRDVDLSLPRGESKAGRGHKGFIVTPNPNMPPREAARRRDFTFNAMAYDPLEGKILDFYGGQDDLAARALRHTSEQFVEDPLRVLRGFQFCGRFSLAATPETVRMCSSLASEYDTLAVERVWGEWEKWAAKSEKPSMGLTFLRQTGWLRFYPEIAALVGVPQHPEFHPEGDAWQHTLCSVDVAAAVCDRDGIKGGRRVVLLLAALLHDVGKVSTTSWSEEKGRWVAYGHDVAGEAPARAFLERIGAPRKVADRVVRLVVTHMRHTGGEVTAKQVRRLAKALAPATVRDWAMVVEADHSGRPPLPGGLPEAAKRIMDIAEQLKAVEQAPRCPLMGRHLIEMGLRPGRHFGEILRAAEEAFLDGEFKDAEGGKEWALEFIIDKGG